MDSGEKELIYRNAEAMVVRMAHTAYALADQHLRRLNMDLKDFDPEGDRHKGDMDPLIPGLRPSYSRDWGEGFGFFAAVAHEQRRQLTEQVKRGDPLTSSLLEIFLTPDSELGFMGGPTTETDTILDFHTYTILINQINKYACHALKKIKHTLALEPFSNGDQAEIMWLNRDMHQRGGRETQNKVYGLPHVMEALEAMGNLDMQDLSPLARPMSDALYAGTLETVIAKSKSQNRAS